MRPTHTAREATSGNNAPETKPIPVEPGEGRHDGIVYTQRRRRGRTSLMGRLLQAKRFVRILTKSTLSTPAPLLRPSAWQHVIPGRLRHAIGSPHTLLMQAGGTPADTRQAPGLHLHSCAEYSFTATGTRPTPDREP